MLDSSGPAAPEPARASATQKVSAPEPVNQSVGAPPAVPTAEEALSSESEQEKTETDRLFGAFAADNPAYAPFDLLQLPLEKLRQNHPSLVLAGAAAAAAASELAIAKHRISAARLVVSTTSNISLDVIWARTILAAYCLPLSDAGLVELFTLASSLISYCMKLGIELREFPHPLDAGENQSLEISNAERTPILAVCALLASTAYLPRNHGLRLILNPIISGVQRFNLSNPGTESFEAIILSYIKLRDSLPNLAGLCSPAAVSLCWKRAFAEMQQYSASSGLFGLYVRLRILRVAAARCALLDEGGNGTFTMGEIKTEALQYFTKLLETMQSYNNEQQLLLSEFDFGMIADSGITLWFLRVCCMSVGLSLDIKPTQYGEAVRNMFSKLFDRSLQARTSFYRTLEMLDLFRLNPERLALETDCCLEPPWTMALVDITFTVEHAVIRAALNGKIPAPADANPFTHAFATTVRNSF